MILTLEHEILIGATEGLGQSGRNSLNVFLRHQGHENQRAGLQLLPLACRHEQTSQVAQLRTALQLT